MSFLSLLYKYIIEVFACLTSITDLKNKEFTSYFRIEDRNMQIIPLYPCGQSVFLDGRQPPHPILSTCSDD